MQELTAKLRARNKSLSKVAEGQKPKQKQEAAAGKVANDRSANKRTVIATQPQQADQNQELTLNESSRDSPLRKDKQSTQLITEPRYRHNDGEELPDD